MMMEDDLVEPLVNEDKLDNGHVFKEDWRKTNPSLHILYMTWAVEHLRAVDEALTKFHDFANLNMHGPIASLEEARNTLTNENAAYYQADQMLKSVGLVVGARVVSPE